MRTILLAFMLLAIFSPARGAQHPEARPFVDSADANADLAAAIAQNDKRIIVIMGANWCHDSRALAGWIDTPRFAAMLNEHYRVIYIDSGTPQTGNGRNLDIAKRFGFNKVRSTPLVMVLSPGGRLLNSRKDAVGWRNAASRSEDAIFGYFSSFTRI